MSLVRVSEEITTIILDDGSGHVYRKNDFNSPYRCKAETILRWHRWIQVLETADQYPELEKAIDDVELIYEMMKKQ